MKLIDQSFEILDPPDPQEVLQKIERAGRTCYKSEHRITPDSAAKFVRGLIKSGHHSVIEHLNVTARIVTNRGVTHELVRHRIASYSQESTRYCNYGGEDMEFIRPVWWEGASQQTRNTFSWSLYESEWSYNELLSNGWTPQEAREVLPNALKTELVVTANLREWRHIFTLRCSKAAHPQIRELMKDGLRQFKSLIPVVFEDLP